MPRAKAPRWKLFLLRRLLHDKRIYNICAALRGPDHFSDSSNEFFQQFLELKQATTAIIRYKLGLRRSPLMSHPDSLDAYWKRRDLRYGATDDVVKRFRKQAQHVVTHAEEAFTALGLEWNDNNSQDFR